MVSCVFLDSGSHQGTECRHHHRSCCTNRRYIWTCLMRCLQCTAYQRGRVYTRTNRHRKSIRRGKQLASSRQLGSSDLGGRHGTCCVQQLEQSSLNHTFREPCNLKHRQGSSGQLDILYNLRSNLRRLGSNLRDIVLGGDRPRYSRNQRELWYTLRYQWSTSASMYQLGKPPHIIHRSSNNQHSKILP